MGVALPLIESSIVNGIVKRLENLFHVCVPQWQLEYNISFVAGVL